MVENLVQVSRELVVCQIDFFAQAARDWSAVHRGDEGIVVRPDPSTSSYAGYPGPVDA